MKKPFDLSRILFIAAAVLFTGTIGWAIFTLLHQQTAAVPSSSTTSNASCSNVLFLGNSQISTNDLPKTFASLAQSGGHQITTGEYTASGWNLFNNYSDSKITSKLSSSSWDCVIFNESVDIIASQGIREDATYPYAEDLARQITEAGATPYLLENWAYRNGMSGNQTMNSFSNMQQSIDQGFAELAKESGITVIPAGEAFLSLAQEESNLDMLLKSDYEPTLAGTYLAACVIYAQVYQESPVGLLLPGTLSTDTGTLLQETAAKVVLGK